MAQIFFSPYDQRAKRWHHWSPTLLQEAEDCESYVLYKRIFKLPEPEKDWRGLGTDMHSEAEHLVDTGQDVFGDRLRPLRAFYPAKLPDPLVKAEWGLDGKKKAKGVPFSYKDSSLWLLGLPVEGYLDLFEGIDPWSPRVSDLKTSKDVRKWAKSEAELKKALPMLLYAQSAPFLLSKLARMNGLPDLSGQVAEVRLRHLYAQTQGAILCRQVPDDADIKEGKTGILTSADVAAGYKRAEELARKLKALEGRTDDVGVAKNGVDIGRCSAYGGCPYLPTCQKTPAANLRLRATLAEKYIKRDEPKHVGDSSAAFLEALRNVPAAAASNEALNRKEENVGILAMAQAQRNGAAPPPAQTVTPQAAPSVVTPPAVVPPVASFGLEDPELKARLPAGGSVQVLPDGSRVLFNAEKQAIGMLPPYKPSPSQTTQATAIQAAPPPAVQAPAAPVVASVATTGTPAAPASQSSPGYFSIGRLKLPDEVQPPTPEEIAKARQTNQGIVPPDAPPNDPNATVEPKKSRAKAKAPSSPPLDAPNRKAETVMPAPAEARAAEASAPAEGKFTDGGKLPIELYVNAIPYGTPYVELDAYAAQIAKMAAEDLQVHDYRLADMGAYKAKGGIAALVRAQPPAPGVYVALFNGFDGPLNEAVATLIPLASKVVKGVR